MPSSQLYLFALGGLAAGCVVAMLQKQMPHSDRGSRSITSTECDKTGIVVISPVDIGTLHPSESRKVLVAVQNISAQPLVFDPPTSSCGCISVLSQELTVDAGCTVMVPFEIKAPDTPGPIEKKIEFRLKAVPGPPITTSLAGDVVAQYWTIPSRIDFEGDPGERVLRRITIHSCVEEKIGLLEAGDSRLIIDEVVRSDNRVAVGITMSIPSEVGEHLGRSHVVVHDVEGAAVLAVPVEWRTRSAMRVYPNSVEIDANAMLSTAERAVFIFCSGKTKGHEVQIEPLVPWVEVIDRMNLDKSVRLTVRIYETRIPAEFGGSILRATLRDMNAQSVEVAVRCNRSHPGNQ